MGGMMQPSGQTIGSVRMSRWNSAVVQTEAGRRAQHSSAATGGGSAARGGRHGVEKVEELLLPGRRDRRATAVGTEGRKGNSRGGPGPSIRDAVRRGHVAGPSCQNALLLDTSPYPHSHSPRCRSLKTYLERLQQKPINRTVESQLQSWSHSADAILLYRRALSWEGHSA